jgi:hypothetical protein
VGYADAETAGDENAEEKGWTFQESSICDVEPYEFTETRYRPKKED